MNRLFLIICAFTFLISCQEQNDVPICTVVFPDSTDSANVQSQSENFIQKEDRIYTWVESPEIFQPGTFKDFIKENLIYPSKGLQNKVEGKVFVEFVIEKDGSVQIAKVVKGLGFGFDEEARRLILLTSQKWKPGKNQGKPVRLKKILPIFFYI